MFLRDMSEREELLARAEAAQTTWRALAGSIPQQVWTELPDGPLNYINEPFAMKVILFGATGIAGQGVLRECLDLDVEGILAVGRIAVGRLGAD